MAHLMSMLNWNEYLKQVFAGVAEIGKISPDVVKGYQTLGAAATKTKLLGPKVNELILAGRRCDCAM